MKKKLTLSAAFLLSLLPMLADQFGGRRGVQEISGLMNLLSPIGILSAALFAAGVWVPSKKPIAGKVLGASGAVGMVISEIYNFFTWHVLTVTGEVSLRLSLRFAFPEFYIGLAVSLGMVAAYFIIDRRIGTVSVSASARPSPDDLERGTLP